MNPQPDIDVAIVGAGISGISMAAHMKLMCPERSFAMFERRSNIGGTWDLFRYPGIRSDSDMHTLGFKFEPWVHEKAIADAPAIREYLDRIVHERGIADHIRYDSKVVSADWHSDEAMWHLTVEDPRGWQHVTSRFLYLASGYYDYDDPHDAQLPGIDKFGGQVIHPQFWPEGLDYAGKKIVVIGSGATAVTIVPAMTDKAAHVTMLQRTPTWMAAGPSRDKIANNLRKYLPEWLAYRITRQKNIRLRDYLFKRARNEPDKVANFLTGMLKQELGEDYPLDDFQPPYPPWDQRLCLVPDSDLFAALKAGTASIKTGHIESFEAGGIRLKSGELLEADIVITATGLRLALGGKVDVSLDGETLIWPDRWFYRGCMFSNVPNLAIVFGYLNASWTLRADNNSDYICRVLNRMHDKRAVIAVPRLPEDHGMEEIEPFPFSSGYLQRAKHLIPKSAPTLPWRLNQDYLEDCKDFRKRPVDDGVLKFERLPAKTEAA
ncbi:NAD(P)-binding protein [Altererythrobacter salegens]|uniref:NAD(P)-binding protein n=1 Tax=Croceibacterium salegens TaxID=1737568 RepID=A0A6I4SSU2_9SPHN|nr:NAD(P)/FAD-dependent oxidoreductase [Croceibacterium salegens]MXO58953.1 NAD(P)-binding protein [Croceibacterium salegens]